MPNKLELNTKALREALYKLPAELTAEADTIVASHAAFAKADIAAGYPRVSGNLVGRLATDYRRATYSTSTILRSRAYHAYMYENGTALRKTDTGAKRGRTKPAAPEHGFIAKAIRARRRMTAALALLVTRAGFQVYS